MFAHFGSQVTVVGPQTDLLPREDRDVAEAVQALLQEQGVTFVLGAAVSQLHEGPDAVTVGLQGGAELVADAVLLTTGRQPATEHLGLEAAGIDASTDLVLGATWFGVDAQEVVNLLALAMRAGVTATELRDGIWTHPSSTEALNEVLAALEPLS